MNITVTEDFASNMTWNDTGFGVFGNDTSEYVFDRMDVRVIFILLYSLVFCCCVLGNFLVILVVMLNRRLKSTEFFMGNLAIADFCVGVFCVLQTINSYLISSWVFGTFLCKMHYFTHSLSCTASIFILVVISVERYLAIVHPIRSRQIMTPKRLKVVITTIWMISTAYSSPRFIFAKTIKHYIGDVEEVLCIVSRLMYNSEVFDMINFVLLYLLPLGIMTVLYTLIAINLRNSTQSYSTSHKCKKNRDCVNQGEGSVVRVKFEKRLQTNEHSGISVSSASNFSRCSCVSDRWTVTDQVSCNNVLQARRRVIKLLVLVVITFAVCQIPFHARKMWQYWSPYYNVRSAFSTLFTPVTFLLTYCNSAINPLLYAFLSRNFRKSMKELSLCKITRKSSKNTKLIESL